MRAQFRLRIRLVFVGILLVSACIIARLYFIQIVEGDLYTQKADRQFASASSGLFDRGSIYFTHKDGQLISAATLSTGFLVAINPQTLTNPEEAYMAISALATSTMSREAFMASAKKTGQVYIEVAHRLSDVAGKSLSAQEIHGVQVLRESWRYYPGETLAAHAIGIVSYGSGDVLVGQTGLEAHYDGILSRSGDSLYKNFFAQLFSNVSNLIVSAEDAHEGNLITTIEPSVETRLVQNLAKLNQKYKSKESGGIIMDPKTGAIIAMAISPAYSGNNLKTIKPSMLTNSLVENVYEFGSIMKPLTMAAGLDARAITPDSTYNDTGCTTVNKSTYCNFDRKARGVVPMQDVLSKSLNIGAAWIANQLGQESFRNYFRVLFGEKTGIDLPSEGRSLLGNLSQPQQIYYDTASFGQGIAMTPVQMIRALGALANGGEMVTPHLVRAVRLETGVTRTLDWDTRVRVFSPDAVREVSTMLTHVADTSLGNGVHRIPSMTFSAKTGTAQLTDGRGGYYDDRYLHSFVGYFPSYAPRFIMLLYTNDPQGVEYASETLTATFMDLTHYLINYYQIPPDRGFSTSTQPGST